METHPDRIRYITLTPEEAEGYEEVMREAQPKRRDWPRYGQYGEVLLNAARKPSPNMIGDNGVEYIGMGYHPDEVGSSESVDRRLAA